MSRTLPNGLRDFTRKNMPPPSDDEEEEEDSRIEEEEEDDEEEHSRDSRSTSSRGNPFAKKLAAPSKPAAPAASSSSSASSKPSPSPPMKPSSSPPLKPSPAAVTGKSTPAAAAAPTTAAASRRPQYSDEDDDESSVEEKQKQKSARADSESESRDSRSESEIDSEEAEEEEEEDEGQDEDDYDDEDDDEDDYEEDEDEEEYDELPTSEAGRKYKPKLNFDLSTFSGTFDAGIFVSELTRDLFEAQDPADFDPLPFQVLFDAALVRLNSLRDETDSRIREYSAQCKRDEEIHKEGLVALQEQLSNVYSQFRRLDNRISSVSHTAARIGHTLSSVDSAKRANLQGQELISHFLAFNEGDPKKLPAIFLTNDPAELHHAAELIQMLSAIAQDLRVKGTKNATDLIADKSNDIENALIERFDSAHAKAQLDEMKACASTLLNFKGRSLIRRYVFNVISKLDTYAEGKEKEAQTGRNRSNTMEDSAGMIGLMEAPLDDKSIVGQFRVKLVRFFRGVILCIKEQCAVCSAVFPQPLSIIKSILERVFQDKIQGMVDMHLNDKRLSTEEWLTSLEFAHAHSLELVQYLQQAIRSIASQVRHNPMGDLEGALGAGNQALGGIEGRSGGGGISLSGGLTSLSSSSASFNNSSSGEQISMMNLNDQVNGIFAGYRESYFDRELSLVRSVCDKNIQTVLNMESARPPGPENPEDTDMFGRVKKTVLQEAKQKWIILVLEYPLVDKLIQQSIQSITRCDKLSESSQLSEHVSNLFLHIAQSLFDDYLSVVLEAANDSLPASDPKSEPDTFYFQVIGLMNLVVDKIQLHFNHWILPRLLSNPNVQIVSENRMRDFSSKFESAFSTNLQRILGANLKYAARIWNNKQKTSDYKPREEDTDALLDGKPSFACESICAYMRHQYDSVMSGLEGKNLDKYLTVFGLKLHDLLVNHLQKYSISTMGAGLLVRDMKAYQLVIASFHLNVVLEKWLELRQIVDLFFVGPEYLKAVINDSSKLSKMDHAYLLSWIEMRADFSDNKRKILQSLNMKESAASSMQPEPLTRDRKFSQDMLR